MRRIHTECPRLARGREGAAVTSSESYDEYFRLVHAEDSRAEQRVGGIRSREDNDELTVREAALERVAVLTEHLAACRNLR